MGWKKRSLMTNWIANKTFQLCATITTANCHCTNNNNSATAATTMRLSDKVTKCAINYTPIFVHWCYKAVTGGRQGQQLSIGHCNCPQNPPATSSIDTCNMLLTPQQQQQQSGRQAATTTIIAALCVRVCVWVSVCVCGWQQHFRFQTHFAWIAKTKKACALLHSLWMYVCVVAWVSRCVSVCVCCCSKTHCSLPQQQQQQQPHDSNTFYALLCCCYCCLCVFVCVDLWVCLYYCMYLCLDVWTFSHTICAAALSAA